ncbi:hypothetical protein VB715_10770 [Crocosphaera sp. UHCC 0190]|uniref:hypothetical protein n=1 Tax=Crocosphaera sp. UHCC 0190 TaxID=3110246 RepID=UPI002B20A2EC|nr:hypothetical protein [Crocosphaera sp. UHCC 0190]MEA5510244.1 hypothetical protein [Crocosphaera sp. UHCC 0190]
MKTLCLKLLGTGIIVLSTTHPVYAINFLENSPIKINVQDSGKILKKMLPESTLIKDRIVTDSNNLLGGQLVDDMNIVPIYNQLPFVPKSTSIASFWLMVGLSSLLKLVELIG